MHFFAYAFMNGRTLLGIGTDPSPKQRKDVLLKRHHCDVRQFRLGGFLLCWRLPKRHFSLFSFFFLFFLSKKKVFGACGCPNPIDHSCRCCSSHIWFSDSVYLRLIIFLLLIYVESKGSRSLKKTTPLYVRVMLHNVNGYGVNRKIHTNS